MGLLHWKVCLHLQMDYKMSVQTPGPENVVFLFKDYGASRLLEQVSKY